MTTPTRPDAAELAELSARVERGETLPWSWYTDPACTDLETQRLFRRSWHYVGRTDQLDGPGRFFTCEVAGVPLVVVRDRELRLRALVNVCRHRGAQVVREDCGTKKSLQCFYHAWTYGLDGGLRAVPRGEREDSSFDKEGLGLLPASVESGAPSSSSTWTPRPRRWRRPWGSCRLCWPRAASTSPGWPSTRGCTTPSSATGRSRSRTTWSATIARSPTRGSAT